VGNTFRKALAWAILIGPFGVVFGLIVVWTPWIVLLEILGILALVGVAAAAMVWAVEELA
jgi:hypothetical protein